MPELAHFPAYVRTGCVRTYAAIDPKHAYRRDKRKRQDTTVMVIPCLCSFNALCSPSAELPINKKRTRTLFRKESGSSTNCMVEHQGVEPWHRSPGLSHFEFYPLRSTQWNIVEVIRLYRKIQTIEITLKISSKSERSRLHADLNPLEKSAKNPPKREN